MYLHTNVRGNLVNTYRVYYQKDFGWVYRSKETSLTVHRSSFELLGEYPATKLEHLFALLNDEVEGEPNPLGSKAYQEIIRSKKLHTSMSVGDLAEDSSTGKLWLCADRGWKEVSWGTESKQ